MLISILINNTFVPLHAEKNESIIMNVPGGCWSLEKQSLTKAMETLGLGCIEDDTSAIQPGPNHNLREAYRRKLMRRGSIIVSVCELGILFSLVAVPALADRTTDLDDANQKAAHTST